MDTATKRIEAYLNAKRAMREAGRIAANSGVRNQRTLSRILSRALALFPFSGVARGGLSFAFWTSYDAARVAL